MKVNVNGRQMKVEFVHIQFPVRHLNTGQPFGTFVYVNRKLKNIRGQTICNIVDFVTKKVISSGMSYCLFGDNFAKETGRHYALNRAVELFDQATQDLIIGAYNNRPRQLKKPRPVRIRPDEATIAARRANKIRVNNQTFSDVVS